MKAAFERLFLTPGSARRLGVSRALFYGWYLLQVFAYDPALYAKLPAELWTPTLVLRPFGPPDARLFHVAAVALEVVLALAALGLWTRFAVRMAAPLGAYVFAVVNGYGYVDFHVIPLVLISWPLAASRCGDAFSLDAVFGGRPRDRLSAEYRWPVGIAEVTLPVLMCTGGLHKVAGGWLQHPVDYMRAFLLIKYYAQASEKALALPDVVLWAADSSALLLPMALTMVFCELGSPLALPPNRPAPRIALIGGLFAMQLNLALALATLPTFPWAGAYVFWVPWERIGRRSGAESVEAVVP